MRDRVDTPPARAGELSAQDGAGRTVLMVDDDPDVRTSVARGLRHSGFDVRVAATGREALRLLSSESHDALVLDVQMPELDGVAVVTAACSLAFCAASVDSGIAPVPAFAQGLPAAASKPAPLGPTRQFTA